MVIWDVIVTYAKLELTLVAIVVYAEWVTYGFDFPTAKVVRRCR